MILLELVLHPKWPQVAGVSATDSDLQPTRWSLNRLRIGSPIMVGDYYLLTVSWICNSILKATGGEASPRGGGRRSDRWSILQNFWLEEFRFCMLPVSPFCRASFSTSMSLVGSVLFGWTPSKRISTWMCLFCVGDFLLIDWDFMGWKSPSKTTTTIFCLEKICWSSLFPLTSSRGRNPSPRFLRRNWRMASSFEYSSTGWT